MTNDITAKIQGLKSNLAGPQIGKLSLEYWSFSSNSLARPEYQRCKDTKSRIVQKNRRSTWYTLIT